MQTTRHINKRIRPKFAAKDLVIEFGDRAMFMRSDGVFEAEVVWNWANGTPKCKTIGPLSKLGCVESIRWYYVRHTASRLNGGGWRSGPKFNMWLRAVVVWCEAVESSADKDKRMWELSLVAVS